MATGSPFMPRTHLASHWRRRYAPQTAGNSWWIYDGVRAFKIAAAIFSINSGIWTLTGQPVRRDGACSEQRSASFGPAGGVGKVTSSKLRARAGSARAGFFGCMLGIFGRLAFAFAGHPAFVAYRVLFLVLVGAPPQPRRSRPRGRQSPARRRRRLVTPRSRGGSRTCRCRPPPAGSCSRWSLCRTAWSVASVFHHHYGAYGDDRVVFGAALDKLFQRVGDQTLAAV